MESILVVEDDKTIAMGIEYSLKQEGFDTHICHNVKDAQKVIDERDFALVILDISLPDGDGFELCRLVRAKGDTPIIFLTVYDDEVNVVMGLDMGADDYITKPFRVRELVSRIKSVLRRYKKGSKTSGKIKIGDITIHPAQAKVYRKDYEIALTPIEYKLLLTLAHNKGRVLSRNRLLEDIWDVAGDFVNDNTLTVYIKRLREKIEENPQHPTIIKTVRGLGYKVDD